MSEKFDLKIRQAQYEDAALLAELGERTFTETFAVHNTPDDMSSYLAASFSVTQQRNELAEPASTFLIAEVDGRSAGYAKLLVNEPADGVEGPEPIELVRLYVTQEWLGRGVGEGLMRACLDTAREAGRKTIWLAVWERNGRAQAFYRKWNFRAVGEHVFQLGSDAQRDIVMEREL